jgi:hypothetical protein
MADYLCRISFALSAVTLMLSSVRWLASRYHYIAQMPFPLPIDIIRKPPIRTYPFGLSIHLSHRYLSADSCCVLYGLSHTPFPVQWYLTITIPLFSALRTVTTL